MNLTGKTALITGGSRGIGAAVCRELARLGARVAICYAGNTQAAEKTVADCQALGAEAFAIRADVSDYAACQTMVETVLERFGRIDILVNNAGITKDNLLLRMSEADFDRVLDTNLKGAFFCMKAVYRPMMKQKSGRISSIVGLHGNAGQANYAASKAGLIGMSKAVAKELAGRGVTVNLVAPGFIDTDMTASLPQAAKDALLSTIPMAKLGAPEDVANAVAFLASDEAGYITGQVLSVDGGMNI